MIRHIQRATSYVCFVNYEHMGGELRILEAGHSFPPAGLMIGPRIRELYIMHFILGGGGVFNGIPVSRGDGFLICPDKLHYFKLDTSDPWEHCWIGFDGDNASRLLESVGLPGQNGIFKYRNTEALKSIADEFYNLPAADDRSPFELLSLFYYMLSLVKNEKKDEVRDRDAAAEYIDKAILFMKNRFMLDIDINEIAKYINISPKYLWRLFNSRLGISPQRYLIELRVLHASKLLQSTSLKVADIARSSGYENALTFTQIFKKYTGRTPTEYRNYIH